MFHTCPHCGSNLFGGMTYVRHLIYEHQYSSHDANDFVDKIYGNKMHSGKAQRITMPDSPGYMTVPYEYLSAKDCEKLKVSVIDKEDDYVWGTTGPKRDEELQKYSISKLSTQHLENILITQPHVENELAAAILMLLKKRYGVL